MQAKDTKQSMPKRWAAVYSFSFARLFDSSFLFLVFYGVDALTEFIDFSLGKR